MFDWSDGEYEHTAATLASAADRAVEAAGVARDERVLDVGCGTGNASLAAARRGARVTGVDPAARLVEVAGRRAASEGLSATFRQGDATALPFADAEFDVALSVFAVIFAPDARAVAAELARVVRPGGRFVITTWAPEGVIHQAGRLLWEVASAANPAPGQNDAPPPRWGDPAFVRELFGTGGARVTVDDARIPFRAASPEAWFAEQVAYHPAWRAVHAMLAATPERWADLRERSLAVLNAGNEEPSAFLATSRYLVVRVDRPG